jgi:hypothetical protein
MTLIGVEVPEFEDVAGRSSGGPPLAFSSAASFSSLGFSCSQDVLFGSLGIRMARRYDGQHSSSRAVRAGSSSDAFA